MLCSPGRPSFPGARSSGGRQVEPSPQALAPRALRAVEAASRLSVPRTSQPTRRCAIEATSSRKNAFTITIGSETNTVQGRTTAVEEAKSISARSGRAIRVERQDGRVRMEFRRGKLETYRFETHGRRS